MPTILFMSHDLEIVLTASYN